MKKSLLNLFVVVLVFVLMFPCNIVAFANAEPDNSVLANGENITPIFTTAPPTSDGMMSKTYIVNTGNHKNLTVKIHDLIHDGRELWKTKDCLFDENNICEVDINYEVDF